MPPTRTPTPSSASRPVSEDRTDTRAPGADESAPGSASSYPTDAATQPTSADEARDWAAWVEEARASKEDQEGDTGEAGETRPLQTRDEMLRDWYESVVNFEGWEQGDSETIGLFGGRAAGSGQYDVSRRVKLARLREIMAIVLRYDIFHGLTPVTLRQMLEELGPTFVKAGQILSMRSEILPERFTRELARLRTDVEPMSVEMVGKTLEHEYGRPLDEIFLEVDATPLGSASVAQVHKATLASGKQVAVKVQRPGVQETMAQDISIMRSLAVRVGRVYRAESFLDLASVVDELWQSFREETDFLVEARSLEEFGRNNADIRYVTCPKPYPTLCTRHVVVMDYVEGIPIGDTKRLVDEGYDLSEIGYKLVDNYTKQILDDGFFHADPHPGNLVIRDGRIVYMDLGIMGRISSHDRKALEKMVRAVGSHDSASLKEGLLRFSIGDVTEVDHARLLADLDEVISDYGDVDLGELDIGAFANAIISLARKSGIELPGSVTMLARSLVTLEGVVDEFLPGVSMVHIISEHVRDTTNVREVASRESKRFAIESVKATRGLLGAASQANLAMNMLTRGQLRVGLELPGTKDPIAELSQSADRLAMGIIVAGLFVGSSVVYYAGIQPVVFGIPVIGFVGYVAALALSVWIIWGIMREGRR